MDKLFNLKITSLSPIHIGCQESLSPYLDFIYEDGQVYMIDEGKLRDFFRQTEEPDQLMDQYINIIGQQAGASISNRDNLKSFFEKHGLGIEDFSSSIIASNARVSQNIERAIHTSGRPYIPGSSLKGSIRTCLLYYHNKEEKLGEGQIFGRFGKDILRNLSLSDTNPVGKEKLTILRTARYNLAKNSEDVPVVYECIQKGVDFTFSLKTTGVNDDRFGYLNTSRIEDIFAIINEFYKDAIYREVEALEKNKHPMFSNIIGFYHELKQNIDRISLDNTRALIRLGGGKNFFDNTISNRLAKEQLARIIQGLSRGKAKTDLDFFPKTRTFVGYGGNFDQVLGWAIIEKL